MKTDFSEIYKRLFDALKKSYPELSAQQTQVKLNEQWNKIKEESKTKTEQAENDEKMIKELLSLSLKKKSENLLRFFKVSFVILFAQIYLTINSFQK